MGFPHPLDKNTGVGCNSILQGIFLTQGLNLSLLHCRQILYLLSHQGSRYTHVYILHLVYLLIYRWPSQVAHLLNNLPVMPETQEVRV